MSKGFALKFYTSTSIVPDAIYTPQQNGRKKTRHHLGTNRAFYFNPSFLYTVSAFGAPLSIIINALDNNKRLSTNEKLFKR